LFPADAPVTNVELVEARGTSSGCVIATYRLATE
jgi:hypothetical protein